MIRLLAVAGQSAEATVVPAAADPPKAPSLAHAIAYSMAAVGIGGGIALTSALDPKQFVAADGFSAFALFYIAAQAIERVIEPFTGFVKASPEAGAPSVPKPEAEANRAIAIALAYRAGDKESEQTQVTVAAQWQKVIDEIRANTAIYAWGAATMLGALASGILGLYFMHAVGATAVPEWLDIGVTGVIVGGGSKSLHDLMKNIEKAKEEKEDPKEVS